jgi:histidinol dehydrogenase
VKRLVLGDARAATVAALRAFAPSAVAVRAHSLRLDAVDLPADYRVPGADLRAAFAGLKQQRRAALELAADNLRACHTRETPTRWRESLPQGQVVGQEVVPLPVAATQKETM